MRLTVFGANGPSGRLVVQQALERGHRVRAVTRHPATFPRLGLDLEVAGADVFDEDAVHRAVTDSDVVISALGVPYSFRQIKVYSVGTAHVVAAMRRQGIHRLLCVSSSSTYLEDDPQAGFLTNHVILPLIANTIGRTTYADVRRMETLVRGSGLDWTIVRPAGLFTGRAVTRYETAEDSLSGLLTARADLADSLLSRIQDQQAVGQVMAVVTTEQLPSMADWFRQEILKRG